MTFFASGFSFPCPFAVAIQVQDPPPKFDFEKQVRKLIISEALTIQEKDRTYDKASHSDINSDVQVKRDIATTKLNVEIVEKYLMILSRVLKNSEHAE